MIPVGLAVLAAAAQAADFVTYDPQTEANPVVLWLGDSAAVAKIGLILSLIFLWIIASDADGRTGYAVKLALCLAVAAGVVGTVSNIL